MSLNRYSDHVVVLPEDAADHNIANGFKLEIDADRQNGIQILPAAGGWTKAFDAIGAELAPNMRRFPGRRLVLLIDFDGDDERASSATIPADIRDRVFIIGIRSEPEELKSVTGLSYETIGRELARSCRDGSEGLWSHELLRHNASELERLRETVRPFLFP